jgi:hypothetical protein
MLKGFYFFETAKQKRILWLKLERRLIACDVGKRRRYTVIR